MNKIFEKIIPLVISFISTSLLVNNVKKMTAPHRWCRASLEREDLMAYISDFRKRNPGVKIDEVKIWKAFENYDIEIPFDFNIFKI